MASAGDIAEVRLNTDEPSDETWTDEVIGGYIDTLGVAGASSKIWGQKAGRYASLVDTTEAGASHAFSDLSKNAIAMEKLWAAKEDEDNPVVTTAARPKIRKIVRL